MSGGYAYVLDLDAALVNGELVDVETVPADEDRPAALDRRGARARTPARRWPSGLLADWPAALGRFSAIVPRDFRRVLEATAAAEANGEDVDEAVMAAARA